MNRFRTKFCLGVAIDKHEMIRVAVVRSDELTSPWPLELRSFPSLESFEEYWHDWFEHEYRVDRVSAVAYLESGLDVLDWLAERSFTLEELDLQAYIFESQLRDFKVPEPFAVAYAQAMGCLLRARAVEFAGLVLTEVENLGGALRKLASQVECLRATLPGHGSVPF